jgi:ribosomal protein S2
MVKRKEKKKVKQKKKEKEKEKEKKKEKEKEKEKKRKKKCVTPLLISRVVAEQLINAGLHVGGNSKTQNNEMNNYVIGKRVNLCLIDLSNSLFFLRRGLCYLAVAAAKKIPVLCVLSNQEGKDYLSDSLKKVGHYGIKGRYIPGTISNYRSVKLIKELPGVVCIADTKHGGYAIKECMNLELPYFGLCDSEMDPNWFCFPVFGNNDSVDGSKLLVYLVYETVMLQEKKLKKKFYKVDLKWKALMRRRG